MSRLPLIVALLLLATAPASATQFWLSPYNNELGATPPANSAAVPTIYNFVTQNTGSVYVWAKPDATHTLKNWSLRIESKLAGNVIKFTDSYVYNPILAGDPNDVRWEYVVQPTTNAAISGEFMGFTLTENSSYGKGIGPSTTADDPYYFGSNSWLLARVDFDAQNVVGLTQLFLQIGLLGLNNVGQTAGQTSVVFGHTGDTSINPGNTNNRQVSIGAADAKVQVLATPDADFDTDLDGKVNGLDFLIWQRYYGLMAGATNHTGDANNDGKTDHIDLAAWEFQYGTTIPVAPLSAASTAVPEPATWGLALIAWGSLLNIASRRGVRCA